MGKIAENLNLGKRVLRHDFTIISVKREDRGGHVPWVQHRRAQTNVF